MKNQIWIGISFAMLSAIANAQPALASGNSQQVSFEGSRLVAVDNGYLLVSPDKQEIFLSKEDVDTIKKLELARAPEFSASLPCYASVKQ